MLHRLRTEDRGFTLLEVITTCLLLGMLVGIAVGPWQSYRTARAHVEARSEVVAALRNAQISAVSEGVTYRVDITAKKAVTYRIPVTGAAVQKREYEIENPAVTFSAPQFQAPDGSTGSSALFYPRGSASPGQVSIARDGRAKVYTVSVEGLTSRVSYTG